MKSHRFPWLLLLCIASDIQAIPVTDQQGRTINVDLISLEKNTARVHKDSGGEFIISLSTLDDESRQALIKVSEEIKKTANTGAPVAKLRVVSNATGRLTDTSWEASWGSYDKDVYRYRAVTVTIVPDTSGEAILELHWIGSEAGKAGNKEVVVFSKKAVTIVAHDLQSHEFAALFVENDAKYVLLNERDRDGLKYAGWVARLISKGGDQIAVVGSRPPLIAIVGKPDLNQVPFQKKD